MGQKEQRPELDDFSVISFEPTDAESYWEGPDFSLHVRGRSEDIHEFLNTEIHVRTAKYLPLTDSIRKQMRRFLRQWEEPLPLAESPPAPQIEEEESPSSTPEGGENPSWPGRFVIQKNGRTIEILVSDEQYQRFFSAGEARPTLDRELSRLLEKAQKVKKQPPEEKIPPDEQIALSLEEDEDMVSETMAQLHLRQGNIGEALRIYQRLCLLFPEKSSYFEAQIQKIKKL